MGKTMDAKIDPKDTNLVQVTTTIKVTKELPIAKGASARKVPALVATPLPPLNNALCVALAPHQHLTPLRICTILSETSSSLCVAGNNDPL